MATAWRWFGGFVLGSVALVVLLYVASRAMPIPEREAEALARIEVIPTLEGRNGFAALWAVAHDVDVAHAEGLLAEEAHRLAALPAWDAEGGSPPYVSVLERFPVLPSAPDGAPAFCGLHEPGCLARVRGDPAGYAALAQMQRSAAERIAALDAYDHFRNTLPPRPDIALPPYTRLTHDLTLQAQRFSSGQVDAALEGVCRDASLARKLVASGDSLIASMIGAALQKGSASLFVDMLSELPPDHPLPANCRQAFAVDGAQTAAICPTMRAEGRWATAAYRAAARASVESPWATLFLDVEKSAARGAGTFDWFCGEAAAAAIGADMPLRQPAPPSGMAFSCIANAAGCTLVGMQAPAYADYALRLQDAAMRQKAVGTWLWLRANAAEDARPLAERVRARPDAFRSAARDIRIEGKTLQVPMYEKRPGEDQTWRLPVPAWMSGTGW